MQLPAPVARLLDALGVAVDAVPDDVAIAGPFGQAVPDFGALACWLGDHCATRAERALRLSPGFDPRVLRIRDEVLRGLARTDAATAAQLAASVSDRGPLEATLHLGALSRMSALAAAGAPDADAAVLDAGAVLRAPRPVARLAAVRIAELGTREGPLGRRARAVLEEALLAAVQDAIDLGASGPLAAQLDGTLAELVAPGMRDRVEAITGRIVDLVALLGGLAAHREGLTARLSALAPSVPTFLAPAYVLAFLGALGDADRGPYLREVHARLLDAAEDVVPRVRAFAIAAMQDAARGMPAFLAAIEHALLDEDAEVRGAAALALADAGTISDAAARELEDLIEVDDVETALAATRSLARAGRAVPEVLLAKLRDPLVQAAARVLAVPAAGDVAISALVAAYVDADGDALAAADPSVQPLNILVHALRGMPAPRAAEWLGRFANGEPALAGVGEMFYLTLEGVDPVPRELLDAGAPLIDVLAGGPADRVDFAALLGSRLWPNDPRIEQLVVDRTEMPVSLIALSQLSPSESTASDLLAIVEDDDVGRAALAIAVLGQCRLGPALARTVTDALAGHIRDDDPLAESAHDALLELAQRGVLTE